MPHWGSDTGEQNEMIMVDLGADYLEEDIL